MSGDSARRIAVELPYGAVMATGGASRVAGMCGLVGLSEPLLWLAVGEAAWIAASAAARHRANWRHWLAALWRRPGRPGAQSGTLTVPLGLAVVATGLATQEGVPRAVVAPAFLAAAWLSTAVCGARFVVSVARGGRPVPVDGGWFLAPAAVLGAGIAAATGVAHTGGVERDVLAWLSLAGAVVGTAGYWAICAAASADVVARGSRGRPRVLWWIAAGCGGLAAASMGAAAGPRKGLWPVALSSDLHVAAVVTWLFASTLAVLVVGWSIWWLLGIRRISTAAPWPPAFSSAVLALGSLAAGKILHAPVVVTIADAVAGLTVALWAVTAGLHVAGWTSSLGSRGHRGARHRQFAPRDTPIGASGDPSGSPRDR
ncbi:MAG: hypothetical protein M0Z82_18065 [Actinomycetota bacterium]|jgi:hypothetical protein|nr:hypothetical protein [Actinomycetota bacterium]